MKRISFGASHVLLASFLVLSMHDTSFAQTSCGSIISYHNDERQEEPIEDCDNPFGVPIINESLSVQLGDDFVEDGEAYPYVGTEQVLHLENTHPDAFFVYGTLYRHDADDYVRIGIANAGEHFTFSEIGTYTLVISEEPEPILSQKDSLFDKLKHMFVPIAHAFGYKRPSFIATFEVVEEVPEPRGISNILFIPGIQASRLYTNEGGNEEKLWEPFGNNDVRKLAMTEEGESIEDVYAKDVLDEVGGVFNLYKGFLESLREDGLFVAPHVEEFPYDWRRDVFDIVENGTPTSDGDVVRPTSTVAYVSSFSRTGKTTIIAHSNGGLLAKAIMLQLEKEGKADLVDKIILIATPQTGTPKALAALLHGYDQERVGGLIVDDAVTREVMLNMPGVYGLLPSEQFIGGATTPVITFDDSSYTKEFRDAYGTEITNVEEYISFLVGEEGRGDPTDDVTLPSMVNRDILQSALSTHKEKLDSWVAPESVEVYEIIGTGLPTIESIEYREYENIVCTRAGVCLTETYLKPFALTTKYGDETVMSVSASYLNSNTIFYNLPFGNAGPLNRNREHADITESKTIQIVVDHILHGSSTENIQFISENSPVFSEVYDVISLHSPARLYIEDVEGNTLGRTEVGGSWKEEINGSNYFEFGESKYLIVPSDFEYEVFIEGEGEGTFTLVIDSLNAEDVQKQVHALVQHVTSSTTAGFRKHGGVFSNVTVDEDGDGHVDLEITLDGVIVTQQFTYSDLREEIESLDLPKHRAKLLLKLTRLAERFYEKGKIGKERKILRLITKVASVYQKQDLVSEFKFIELKKIIEHIKK